MLERHVANHLAAALIRRNPVEPFGLAIEHAHTCRAVDLMRRKGVKVHVRRLHIDRAMGHRLRTIHKDRHPVRMCHASDLRHRIDRP